MKLPGKERAVRGACVLALVALGLMMWSLVDPRPIPVILAMSVAQALGTLSFATFLIVVVLDLRRTERRRDRKARHSGWS
jgi:peptidoglycan/LPS O-acetylase OafA/YrhL